MNFATGVHKFTNLNKIKLNSKELNWTRVAPPTGAVAPAGGARVGRCGRPHSQEHTQIEEKSLLYKHTFRLHKIINVEISKSYISHARFSHLINGSEGFENQKLGNFNG